MQISVLYRTHAGGNAKQRPAWYDRAATLRSLQHAESMAGVPVTVTFVVDRQMPPELTQLVRPQDQVVTIAGGSAAKSFRSCLGVAVTMAAAATPDTFLWFAEDDYAYRPESLHQLATAVAEVGDADYFTLYAPDDYAWHAEHASQPFYPLRADEERHADIDRRAWHRVRQTTSTFGVRRDALLEDARLLRLGSTVGAPFDSATWVALQGIQPFPWRHTLRDLDPYLTPRGLVKVPAKPLMRGVLNAAARTRRRPRVLMAPREHLAMHLEHDKVPPGAGWDQLGRS